MRLLLALEDGTLVERWDDINMWALGTYTGRVLVDEIITAIERGERIEIATEKQREEAK